MNRFRELIEYNLFGVCSYLGEKMNISTTTIRKYFIYISFLTMGSPVIFYFITAFWMNLRRYIWISNRNPIRY